MLIQCGLPNSSQNANYNILQFITKLIMRRQENAQPDSSKSDPTDYRLQFTKITDHLPYGEFVAYCIVSKQTSKGLFVNQRLLTINTHTRQLSLYSSVPPLPLRAIGDLGETKQKVNYQSANRFEFLPQRIRIGHVTVRWLDKNQSKSWKLIMGSNKLAQQLQTIIKQSSARKKNDSLRWGRDNNPNNSRERQTHSMVGVESPKKSEQTFQHSSPKKEVTNKKLEQIIATNQSNRPQIYSPISLQNQLAEEKIYNKDKMQAEYISISINRVDNSELSPRKSYPKPDYLLQKKQKQVQSKPNSQSLVNQWLQATTIQEKATIYLKFATRCKKKIQTIMQNFFASHLQHEQQDNICVLYDGEIKYLYCPLIETLESEGSPEDLTRKIVEEEQLLREFECLDYLSTIDRIGQAKIVVPMTCIVSYKAMKFYCKSTLDFVGNKAKISRDMHNYSEMFSLFQKKCRFKLDGREQIYEVIVKEKNQVFVINKVRNLPDISPFLPISREYIESYVTEGIISGDKDIRAIKAHLMTLIGQDLMDLLAQKHLFSCFQMMTTIRKMGLSYHYLHIIIQQAKSKKLNYLQRVLQSQILAIAMEWQIRRKIQFQIFKKRQFGFAINQIKMSISMLFQQEKYYLRLLTKIVNHYFGYNSNFQTENIESNVVGEMVLASLLHKLNLNFRVDVQEQDCKGWIWKDNYIQTHLSVQPFLEMTTLSTAYLNDNNRYFLQRQLVRQFNFQIQQTPLQSVLTYLGFEKDRNGFYLVSPHYQLLNEQTKRQVNFYLSHFLTPSRGISPVNVLQSTIYNSIQQDKSFLTSFQYLILFNKIRWLIKEDSKLKAQELIEKSIKRAQLWSQSLVLVQIYDFYAKYKFRYGYVREGLQYTQKSLQIALEYYEEDSGIPAELLIAQQAFSAGNFHLLTQNFTQSLNLFSIAEKIIKKINTEGENITLNPEFILLFARKCQIFLIFGEYQNCLDQCNQGILWCTRFKDYSVRVFVDENQFKIYEILFRNYQTKNMRKQMIQVSNFCCEKYFEDKVKYNQPVDQNLLSEVIKLQWISIVKQVEVISPISTQLDPSVSDLKYIYLKKVHKELVNLGRRLRFDYRYNKKQVTEFLKRKVIHKSQYKTNNLLKNLIVDCLASVTMSSDGFKHEKLFDQEAFGSPWLMLEAIACMTSYEFLVGIIENSLHLYAFQY